MAIKYYIQCRFLDIVFENFTSARKKIADGRAINKNTNEIKINNSAALHNSSYYFCFFTNYRAHSRLLLILIQYIKTLLRMELIGIHFYTRCLTNMLTVLQGKSMYPDQYSIIPKVILWFLFDSFNFWAPI